MCVKICVEKLNTVPKTKWFCFFLIDTQVIIL